MAIQRHDWSLQRKGIIDQERHKERVREAIKKNLGSIVSNESIILSDGQKSVKIPIRSLDEYKFRYNHNKQKHVAQGDGDSKVGDVVGVDDEQRAISSGEAGNQEGQDYYETEIDIDELATLIFEDLHLPYLKEKRKQTMQSKAVRFTEIRRSGILSNLDKKRSIIENIKRNAKETGQSKIGNFKKEDLRFKTWEEEVKNESNAVIIAMMDVSGSMGEFKKYIARSFYFWMVRFLRTKYDNVSIIFISHHTEAKEVTEDEFFTQGESGGTVVSSAYKLALKIIKDRFNPIDWNIYPFHFSDGDNYYSDNEEAIKYADNLIATCNLFGYGEISDEITSHYRRSSNGLLSLFKEQLQNINHFVGVHIDSKEDVYPALKEFFKEQES